MELESREEEATIRLRVQTSKKTGQGRRIYEEHGVVDEQLSD